VDQVIKPSIQLIDHMSTTSVSKHQTGYIDRVFTRRTLTVNYKILVTHNMSVNPL